MSYQKPSYTERRAGQIRFYGGGRAGVAFFDGSIFSMPSEPFIALGLKPGDRFVLVAFRGPSGILLDARIEKVAPPSPPAPKKTTPKIYERIGRGISTKKKPPV